MKSGRSIILPAATPGKVVRCAPPPRPSAALGLCLGVLPGWEIVRTKTSRQFVGARTQRDFATIMLVHEATLNFQLVRYGDEEPLTTTKRLRLISPQGSPTTDSEVSGLSA